MLGAMPSGAPSVRSAEPVREEDVLAALARHRDALREGDAQAVEGTLARGARRPSERDLLIDLIAAEGAAPAAKKLARFWQKAQTEPVCVRVISPDEAEVYERLALPGAAQELDMVTLLRRDDEGGFRVVVTQRAPADVLRAKILSNEAAFDDVAVTRDFTSRYGRTGELILDDEHGGVFGHPVQEWVASVATVQGGIDVALVPGPEPLTRSAQLAWLARVVNVLARHVHAPRVAVPAAAKIVGIEAFAAVADTDAISSRALLIAWAGLHRNANVCYTSGLGSFGLPEASAEFADWGGDESTTRKVVAAAARAGVGGSLKLQHSAVTVGGYRVLIEPGPRGPTPGRTFGRLGSVSLRPLRNATVAESGVVERVRSS